MSKVCSCSHGCLKDVFETSCNYCKDQVKQEKKQIKNTTHVEKIRIEIKDNALKIKSKVYRAFKILVS